MMRGRRIRATAVVVVAAAALSGCGGWRGANSLPLPGTQGGGPGSFTIQAQLPDVNNIERNSRVRVGDVTVGNVTKIERQGWNALLTMTVNGDVNLPANSTATVGQTSLLGSLHIELAPPTDVPPQGKLKDGSLIPLRSGAAYPSTEQTLSAVSLLLNGGGIGQIQEITRELSTAFRGREDDLRSLITELDKFVDYLNDQTGDIIAASDSLNKLAGQVADQKPVVDKALKTIPDALAVLNGERDKLADALDALGKFAALTADSVNQSKENLVKNADRVGAVMLKRLEALKEKYRVVGEVRGRGLLLGIELVKDRRTKEPLGKDVTHALYKECLRRGLAAMTYSATVRINPPLIISEETALAGLAILDEALEAVVREHKLQ